MRWFNDLKVALKVLTACFIFMFIILAISANNYSDVRNADDEFKVFYEDKFLSAFLTSE